MDTKGTSSMDLPIIINCTSFVGPMTLSFNNMKFKTPDNHLKR